MPPSLGSQPTARGLLPLSDAPRRRFSGSGSVSIIPPLHARAAPSIALVVPPHDRSPRAPRRREVGVADVQGWPGDSPGAYRNSCGNSCGHGARSAGRTARPAAWWLARNPAVVRILPGPPGRTPHAVKTSLVPNEIFLRSAWTGVPAKTHADYGQHGAAPGICSRCGCYGSHPRRAEGQPGVEGWDGVGVAGWRLPAPSPAILANLRKPAPIAPIRPDRAGNVAHNNSFCPPAIGPTPAIHALRAPAIMRSSAWTQSTGTGPSPPHVHANIASYWVAGQRVNPACCLRSRPLVRYDGPIPGKTCANMGEDPAAPRDIVMITGSGPERGQPYGSGVQIIPPPAYGDHRASTARRG